MDKDTLAERLGAQPGGDFQVHSIQPVQWGHELLIEFSYVPKPGMKPIAFHIHLRDCRELQWRLYAHLRAPEDQSLTTATLVNILLGRDNHRKPMNILTDFFGLTASYGEMTIQKTE